MDEPGAIESQPGDPNANTPEGVAHAEPDSTPGEDTNPDANAPMHSEGMGPDVLLEEDETAGGNASIEGDKVPRIELQEPSPRVSHLTIPEDNMFLTLSSQHITPEAASTQRSPAINTMTLGTLKPDRGTDLDSLLHDTPLLTSSKAARTQHLPDVNTGSANWILVSFTCLVDMDHLSKYIVLVVRREFEYKCVCSSF